MFTSAVSLLFFVGIYVYSTCDGLRSPTYGNVINQFKPKDFDGTSRLKPGEHITLIRLHSEAITPSGRDLKSEILGFEYQTSAGNSFLVGRSAKSATRLSVVNEVRLDRGDYISSVLLCNSIGAGGLITYLEMVVSEDRNKQVIGGRARFVSTDKCRGFRFTSVVPVIGFYGITGPSGRLRKLGFVYKSFPGFGELGPDDPFLRTPIFGQVKNTKRFGTSSRLSDSERIRVISLLEDSTGDRLQGFSFTTSRNGRYAIGKNDRHRTGKIASDLILR